MCGSSARGISRCPAPGGRLASAAGRWPLIGSGGHGSRRRQVDLVTRSIQAERGGLGARRAVEVIGNDDWHLPGHDLILRIGTAPAHPSAEGDGRAPAAGPARCCHGCRRVSRGSGVSGDLVHVGALTPTPTLLTTCNGSGSCAARLNAVRSPRLLAHRNAACWPR